MQNKYWTLHRDRGVHWLVSPRGERMVYTSVQCVGPRHGSRVKGAPTYDGLKRHHGSLFGWIEETERRLKSWGMKGLGAWNHGLWRYRETPFTECLNIWKSLWVKGKLKPIFDADWNQTVEDLVKPQIRGLKDAPALAGWFLDNEIPWNEGWLFDYFDGRRADDPNKHAVVAFLKRRHRTIARLNAAWGTRYPSFTALGRRSRLGASQDRTRADRIAFLGMVAREFFARTCRIVRALDPNRLILGVRYAGFPAMEVVAGQKGHTDVISVNLYIAEGKFPVAQAAEANRLTGQPVWVTEFSWHAPWDNRSGDRNTIGFGSRVREQASRGRAYRSFVEGGAALPFVIGFDWFQWCDESPMGRGDGEDVNFGLVDIHDRPYEDLVRQIRRTNLALPRIHARAAGWKLPWAPPVPLPVCAVPRAVAGSAGDLLPDLKFRPSPDPQPVKLTASARLAWTPAALRVTVDVADAVRTVEVDRPMKSIEWFWMSDAVELLLRAGGDAPEALDAASLKIWALPDAAGRGRAVVGAWRAHRRVRGAATGVRVRQSRIPGGYRMAFAVPSGVLQKGPFRPWQVLRFNLLVEDCEKVREVCWSAHQGDWTTEKPRTWGRLALVP